jgi:hypothetical protein
LHEKKQTSDNQNNKRINGKRKRQDKQHDELPENKKQTQTSETVLQASKQAEAMTDSTAATSSAAFQQSPVTKH